MMLPMVIAESSEDCMRWEKRTSMVENHMLKLWGKSNKEMQQPHKFSVKRLLKSMTWELNEIKDPHKVR